MNVVTKFTLTYLNFNINKKQIKLTCRSPLTLTTIFHDTSPYLQQCSILLYYYVILNSGLILFVSMFYVSANSDRIIAYRGKWK